MAVDRVYPVRFLLPPLLLLSFPVLFRSTPAVVAAAEYQWTSNAVDYPSDGRRLSGHVIATYDNVYMVTQCAYRCRMMTSVGACASYNFLPSRRTCEINSATHVTNLNDVVADADSQYFLSDAFTIDQAALGPCASSPCQNSGTCLSTTSTSGVLQALCLCTEGWTGQLCELPETDLPVWSDWTDWSICSTSCGDGVKLRKRQCVDNGSKQVVSSQLCYGRDVEEFYCNVKDCPAWTDYGAWGQCSTDIGCGQGVQERQRSCSNGGTIGVDRLCMGPDTETTVCQSPSCDVPVQLVGGSTYGEGRIAIYDDVNQAWLPVCATGWTKTNSDVVCRQLGFLSGSVQDAVVDYGVADSANSAVGNVTCLGTENFLASCPHSTWSDVNCAAGPHAGVQCIVDGRWSAWAEWTDCSVSCAAGINFRTRVCDSPAPLHGGKDCDGLSNQTRPCTKPPCPVDASWADWQAWSTCSVSCGGGSQTRTRLCNPGLYGGRTCLGDSNETQTCNTQHCPVDGSWSAWSAWGQCNATCGGGTQTRTRICQQPLYGGLTCPGPASDVQSCNPQSCAIDGVWQAWGDWSSCNATCGSGTRVRIRQCTGPFYGGLGCVGDSQQGQFCNDAPCPVDGQWSAWTRWLECSETCSVGVQQRYRVCYGATNGGKSCPGDANQYQPCDMGPCPINCTWLSWGDWSACNTSCGGGTQIRTRATRPAQYGGLDCVGSSTDSQVCNTNPCPIPGLWTPWSDWSMCSVTCGTGGLRMRFRTCNMTSFGSLTVNCSETDGVGANQTATCNQFNCTPIAISCQDWYKRGLEDNTYVWLDPDGTNGNNPFSVFCQRNGSAVYTTVHTGQEAATPVQGYQGSCEFYSAIRYLDILSSNTSITINQLIPLVNQSTTCRQYIQWRCIAAVINSAAGTRLTFWRNRNGQDMGYWGGATPVPYGSTQTVMCSCGEKQTCGAAGLKCFCDMNDKTWRSDDGYIANAADLPVQSFCAGATGNTGSAGYFVVGPLICGAT